MPYTRRDFLRTSGFALASTAAAAPLFVQRFAEAADPAPNGRSRPGFAHDRVLVVIQMSGGNDGLNTLIPFGDDAYHRARPRLAVADGEVLKLDPRDNTDGLGLHPALGPLKELYDDGQAAIIQGVGYPEPNRSHFASMDIWHLADPPGGASARSYGWLGRAVDHLREHHGLDPSQGMIALGSQSPLAGRGRRSRAVSFERPDLFRYVGREMSEDVKRTYDRLSRRGPVPGVGDPGADPAAFVMKTALDAQLASDRVRSAVSRPSPVSWPNSNLATQLRQIAAMIAAGLPTRVYYASFGSFDTHAQQAFTHQRLLGEFAEAIRAFQRDLAATGHDRRVFTLAFSEFGRRVAQNASNGTDHGAAGPMFAFGPAVKPGLHGEMPLLTNLDNGDLRHTVDFRRVYAAALERWMRLDATEVLGERINPLAIV